MRNRFDNQLALLDQKLPEAASSAAAGGKGSAKNFGGVENDYGYGKNR